MHGDYLVKLRISKLYYLLTNIAEDREVELSRV